MTYGATALHREDRRQKAWSKQNWLMQSDMSDRQSRKWSPLKHKKCIQWLPLHYCCFFSTAIPTKYFSHVYHIGNMFRNVAEDEIRHLTRQIQKRGKIA